MLDNLIRVQNRIAEIKADIKKACSIGRIKTKTTFKKEMEKVNKEGGFTKSSEKIKEEATINKLKEFVEKSKEDKNLNSIKNENLLEFYKIISNKLLK
jgi:hypothetical protein